MSETLRGVWAAALTPQKADQSIDLDAMVAHQRWLLAQGCDGIAVAGTTGEANSFTVAERLAVIDAVADAGIAAHQAMIGVGCCALGDTVTLAKAALAAGYVNCLMLPPFYYKGVSDDGLFRAFAESIERIADPRLRVYVYDFPKMTGLEIGTELLVRLAEAFPGTIVGVKDSSGRWDDMHDCLEALPGFGLFAGTETYLLPALQAGGAGCISATVNVTSQLAAAVYRAFGEGDGAAAEAAQAYASEVRAILDDYPAIPALKRIMADSGGAADWRPMRAPMMPLSGAEADRLLSALAAAGFRLADAA